MDLIFPRGEIIDLLEKMSASEGLATFPLCEDKSGLIPEMRDMTVVFGYRNRFVRQMIWELKYRGNKKMASLCGELLLETIERISREKNVSLPAILIPIPLSKERRRERGFNQNELVAEQIILQNKLRNKVAGLSKNFNLLEKVRHTVPQSSIKNRRKRMENLNGCFFVPQPEMVRGKNIILVDDVVTTGSTLREARAALLSAGARHVFAIAIAH